MKLIEWVMTQGYELKVATSIIKQGKVLVNSQSETMINYLIKPLDQIKIKANLKTYVSRGALKLKAAIQAFNLNFEQLVVLDIGASTGGFTQVALMAGAKKVYAVDVGTNQLAFKLRQDKRVIAMEQTNLKVLTKSNFQDQIDIVVCDVSFISLLRVFEVTKELLKPKNLLVVLIKPQFEANSNEVEKGGLVPERLHQGIIKKVKDYASQNNFYFQNLIKSPIKGKISKNQEYIAIFTRR